MLILRKIKAADEPVLRIAHDELALDHSNFLLDSFQPTDDFSDYLKRVHQTALGVDMAPGRVRADFLVAEVDGEVVGRTSIRHELNDWLLNFGGHIGYAVRPQFRRLGYATEILRQSLELAQTIGLQRILMTCNDDNVASMRVIERHGGVLENKIDDNGKLLRRYWITRS
ncbi:MAG: hypothetical protein RIS26_749 [Actinomycetota bacterium]|jgi:predicted acetyltransferase